MGLLSPLADMDPSDFPTRILTSVILTGEFTEDIVSADVLSAVSRTGSSTVNMAPAVVGRLFRAEVETVGCPDELRERDPLAGRSGR